MSQNVDITPSPRVLRMLGQIDFAPWQCLAELIDNSIDAFLEQRKTGNAPACPRISVFLPPHKSLHDPDSAIRVRDNGKGMTREQLANAVRAGYSGNDPVEKMGLFGMGFNIATARLGKRTEVWTTLAESDEWVGLIIDFDELEGSKKFSAPLHTRTKNHNELAERTSGTEVRIYGLESERTGPLVRGISKGKTKNKLGKIYGKVMTDLGIQLVYDGDIVTPRKHCVWSPDRFVDTKAFGRVPAVMEIREEFESRRYCETCWVWLTKTDDTCPSCGSSQCVQDRARRIQGWIGIQRYFHKTHYGIDLLRNGRVIEELNKDFFTFIEGEGEDLFEYPIDATHWGGRIVGELEIDFVRVSHQKDSFDKLDPEWKHVRRAVRGASPLQPVVAKRMGLGQNTSPLARLFSGYRKAAAGLKSLVPGSADGTGLNVGPIERYTEKFYAGEAEYQSDEKWYELVLQAEKALRGDSEADDDAGGDLPLPDGSTAEKPKDDETGGAGERNKEPVEEKEKPEIDIDLSTTVQLGRSGTAVRVEAYRHRKDIDGKPFVATAKNAELRFDYNSRSAFFEESLTSPLECLLPEIASRLNTLESALPSEAPLAMRMAEIVQQAYPQAATDLSSAGKEAESILLGLRRHLEEALPSRSPIDPSVLGQKETALVKRGLARNENIAGPMAEGLIREGRFARYVSASFLVELVRRWPDLVSDGNFFRTPVAEVSDPALRNELIAELCSALNDIRWIIDSGGASVSKDQVWRLRYGRALASLRLLQSWQA